jgi:hypothetical protein
LVEVVEVVVVADYCALFVKELRDQGGNSTHTHPLLHQQTQEGE